MKGLNSYSEKVEKKFEVLEYVARKSKKLVQEREFYQHQIQNMLNIHVKW